MGKGIFEQIRALVPDRETISAMPAREVEELFADLTRAGRCLEATALDAVDTVDRQGYFRIDGHASMRGWMLAKTHDAPEDAGARIRSARALRLLDGMRERLRDGELPIGHVRLLASAYSNPRVREHLPEAEGQLLDRADRPHAEFADVVRTFVEVTDADGAEQRAEATHEHRRAHLSQLGDGWRLDASCGRAQGAVMDKVLQEYCRKEFEADWADAKARLGDDGKPTKADLARTNTQRRFDAMYEIFAAAASTAADAQRPEPLVNLNIDVRTFNETVAKVVTGVRPPLDLSDLASRRCGTTDGHPIPPSDVLAAALTGQVRRVVVDSAGTVIHLGRRRRLFTGSAREAVMLRSTHCVWSGCTLPASTCQADHVDEWSKTGESNADNGAPCCGRHNRWKNRGFRIEQDGRGRWNTYRPDGTNINDPPAA